MRKVAITLVCALALSGCFETKTPLFDAKDAVYPIASGTHYLQYMSSDKGGWTEQGRGTITLDHGWYVAKSADNKDTIRFLLKPWGKNYLAVAQDDDDKPLVYLYGVMRPEDGAFYEYGPQCRDFDPQELQKRGLVTIKPGDDENCAPVSLTALETIMQMVLDTKAKPDNKYVLVK